MLYYCPTISAQSPFPLELITVPVWPLITFLQILLSLKSLLYLP